MWTGHSNPEGAAGKRHSVSEIGTPRQVICGTPTGSPIAIERLLVVGLLGLKVASSKVSQTMPRHLADVGV